MWVGFYAGVTMHLHINVKHVQHIDAVGWGDASLRSMGVGVVLVLGMGPRVFRKIKRPWGPYLEHHG